MLLLCMFVFIFIGFCDFESGYCYWANTNKGDTVDWELDSGGTFSSGTGPSKDHTTGTGDGKHLMIDRRIHFDR